MLLSLLLLLLLLLLLVFWVFLQVICLLGRKGNAVLPSFVMLLCQEGLGGIVLHFSDTVIVCKRALCVQCTLKGHLE